MQKQELNTGCTDAPNGVTPRQTDETTMIGDGSAALSEGEEHRTTLLRSWKTTPTDFLTVGGNKIQDAVPEAAKEGV